MKIADNSLAHATLQALYLQICERKVQSPQKAREGDKFDVFTKVSEPPYKVVLLCNVVLNNIQRF